MKGRALHFEKNATGIIRQAITRRLVEKKWTIYRLAKELEDKGMCCRSTVYKCMNGSTSMSIDLAGHVLEALGLEITTKT